MQVEGVHKATVDAEERQAYLELSPAVKVRHLMETVRLMVRLHPARENLWAASTICEDGQEALHMFTAICWDHSAAAEISLKYAAQLCTAQAGPVASTIVLKQAS